MSNKTSSDLLALFNAAYEDVQALLMRLDKSSELDKRNFARAVFAFVESQVFSLKQNILLAPHHFSDAELMMLREETHEISDNGAIKTRPARISLRSNLRFTIRCHEKITKFKALLKFDGAEWQKFQAAIKIRDRLMHPKKVSDFSITDEEHSLVVGAFYWFHIGILLTYSQVFHMPEAKMMFPGIEPVYVPCEPISTNSG